MEASEALESLRERLAPDPRITLWELAVEGEALTGVAAAAFADDLAPFAAEHGLTVRVHYPEPAARQVRRGRVRLRATPTAGAETVTEAIYGEAVEAFETSGEYQRVALARDGYLGWLPSSALAEQLPEPNHRFGRLRGHAYAGPSVRARPVFELSFGAALAVEEQVDQWCQVRFGNDETAFVKAAVLAPFEQASTQPDRPNLTRFALRFLEAPYRWGGVTAWGLDCSGLTQTVFGAFGLQLPRDSDQQAGAGREIAVDELLPGDLLFFPGHVAIALGDDRLLHASAHHLRVAVDTFSDNAFGELLQRSLTGVRRLL